MSPYRDRPPVALRWTQRLPLWSLRSLELLITAVLPVCVLLSYGACVYAVASCATRTPADVAAESEYTVELLRCVDRAHTLAESKACRQEVNRRWQITETVTEAGSDSP